MHALSHTAEAVHHAGLTERKKNTAASVVYSLRRRKLQSHEQALFTASAAMVAMTKRLKTFQIVLSDPSKTFYCGGEKVCGRVEVEVNELTRVSAVKVVALGCAKVEYAKGKQRCRQEAEYLRHEEVLSLHDQPKGKPRAHWNCWNCWNYFCPS